MFASCTPDPSVHADKSGTDRRQMNVLITGGAGFIGSHLAERLLEQGEQVRVIDNLSTGSPRNIQHLKSVRGFQCFVDTITNQSLMKELIDEADVIYHLAAAVGV